MFPYVNTETMYDGVLKLHHLFLTIGFFGKLNPFKKKQTSIKPVTGTLLDDILQ